MKYITQILCVVLSVSGVAQNQLPIYDNIKIVKEYKMDLSENKVFIEAPFARPELNLEDNDLKDLQIKRITYLYSYNNNHPEFAQSKLSDERYKNLVNLLSAYDLSGVEWETKAQAGCGEIPCSEELYHGFVIEYIDPAQFFGQHHLEEQLYTIDNNTASTVTGKDGTRLEIPANAFVDAFGNTVSGKVDIQLKEAVTTTDIVLGGLFTVTEDGAILESKGMIEITASQGDKELELNDGAEIKVELPTTYEEGFKVFQGEHHDGQLVWTNPQPMDNESIDAMIENNSNTRVDDPELEMEDYNRKLEGNEDEFFFDIVESKEMMDFYPLKVEYNKGQLTSVTLMNYGKRILVTDQTEDEYLVQKGLRKDHIVEVNTWFEQDTVIHDKIQWVVSDFQDITFDEYVENLDKENRKTVLQNNVFSVTKTGWANCDRYSGKRKGQLSETLAAFEEPEGYTDTDVCLLIPGDNVCVQGMVTTNGNIFVQPLPKNKRAILVATTWKDEEFYMAISEFKIGEEKVATLQPVRTESADIRKKIYNAL